MLNRVDRTLPLLTEDELVKIWAQLSPTPLVPFEFKQDGTVYNVRVEIDFDGTGKAGVEPLPVCSDFRKTYNCSLTDHTKLSQPVHSMGSE